MGFAIAEVLEKQGAEVTLIAGPTLIQLSSKTIRRVNVQTAAEMYDETMRYFPSTDIVIMAAAVADYTPLMKKNQKIKKNDEKWSLNLTKTTDILAKMGAEKQKNQILVGFALETENELPNAIKKLENKNLDFIVLNSLSDEGAGFGVKTNKITIIDKNKVITEGVKKDKYLVAQDIVNEVIKLFSHEGI
jgi:phosphopantothenoylcysteine decarboxylase/phosphopantothenate--cysteine ligase